jgi:hypothetical protein
LFHISRFQQSPLARSKNRAHHDTTEPTNAPQFFCSPKRRETPGETMTTSTTPPSEIDRLRAQRLALRLQLDIRRLQAAVRQQSPAEFTAAPAAELTEDFGDVVDRREYLSDTPEFGIPVQSPCAVLSDRQEGKFWPIYQCEQDLARIRGRAHNVATLTPMHAGVVDALANYVIGAGFVFTAQPVVSRAADLNIVELAAAVQETIDGFLDDNEFCGSLDREAHARSRDDGEAFLLLTSRPAGRVEARFLECEQITQPADSRPLEDWLGCGEEFPSSWTFGIHTPACETNRPLGYHVVFDGTGLDWDYIPAGRLEHLKRNVPANAKRGVSDFYPVLGDLEREAKLRRNTAHSAALQAAIAWILEPPAGTLSAQAQAPGSDLTVTRYQRPVAGGGSREQDVSLYPPGTILRPSAGMIYKPGPMGSERNPNFLLVGQYLLRAIAVRWNMPEYLISADASNANYASSLVAESPFVKAREADQQFYKRHFRSLLWKVVRLAWEAGRFARFAVSWEALASLVEIKVDAPAVATRDTLKLAQTQELQMQLGILSPRTAAAQAGLDYDAECQSKPGIRMSKEN